MTKDLDRFAVKMTVNIVSAYVSNLSEKASADELSELIEKVHVSVVSICNNPNVEKSPKPTVPLDQTVHNDYIICLEDGGHFKSLRRHLRVQYNMSPDDYRKKWGLPANYPMVPPSYAQRRSTLAKKIGLGHRNGPRK